jgi:DNA primase
MTDRGDIDEVRQRVDLVSVVEKYVTLKRSGRGLVGLCPFHQEKTPSFHVNPELGLWKCFGQCAEGGDVFKFVQKAENLSFPEALERLALQAGVTLTPRGGPATQAAGGPRAGGDDRERLYFVNALALRYYRDMLQKTPPARRYLEQRGLAQEAVEAFSLGYAPELWEGLTQFLVNHNASMADAVRAGLVSQNDRGGYFDKMRGRLVFPIFDVQERPVGFGGRLLGEPGPGAPKYWNSPETPVFSKSRTLYGLDRARKSIAAQGKAIVVEGYTDVVAAHQAGFENTVATLGTSLTVEHVQALARLAPTVLLAFDADSAGLKAAFRAAAIFEEHDVDVRVLDLPEGEDPDSLLHGNKRAIFDRAVKTARSLTEYRLNRLIKEHGGNQAGRVILFRKALPILAAIPNRTERAQYEKFLAPFHPYDSANPSAAVEQISRDVLAYQQGHGMPAWVDLPREDRFARNMPPARPRGSGERAESDLLRVLTGPDPGLAEQILTALTPDEFWTENGRALAAYLYDAYAADFEPEMRPLVAQIEEEYPPLAQALLDILLDDSGPPLTSDVIQDAIARMKRRRESESLMRLEERIKAGTAGAGEMQEYLQRQRERKGLSRAV